MHVNKSKTKTENRVFTYVQKHTQVDACSILTNVMKSKRNRLVEIFGVSVGVLVIFLLPKCPVLQKCPMYVTKVPDVCYKSA